MKSVVKLTNAQWNKLLSTQGMCDSILRKFDVDPDDDGLLLELSRISASVEQIWQDYYKED